ncbi:iron-sulfur cluster assembly scaffold protein [Paenibacillus alba]|uniref:Iron-sulfur cluster assembly scaffold protein n=1 Tax=Paenibacillus alba TaxID=1197127 RepID=A0ABU6GA08_9BACL|nr:iron-sulfur cluster assembly scaffold protein [Paenibacillus alba]MEC0231020.1 iron-sulfur cluster assembly scaffold protein [Paenibacillus alba]NQX69826.1 iron-sulfur cluster assembly scaffold protein [Paenibacillus alba]
MYNAIISDHFMNPRNIGEIVQPDLAFRIGNPICGDTMHVCVTFHESQIKGIKYKAYGCAASIATASIFSEFVQGKAIAELSRMSQTGRRELLGELEPNQKHCLDILDELFDSLCTVKEV